MLEQEQEQERTTLWALWCEQGRIVKLGGIFSTSDSIGDLRHSTTKNAEWSTSGLTVSYRYRYLSEVALESAHDQPSTRTQNERRNEDDDASLASMVSSIAAIIRVWLNHQTVSSLLFSLQPHHHLQKQITIRESVSPHTNTSRKRERGRDRSTHRKHAARRICPHQIRFARRTIVESRWLRYLTCHTQCTLHSRGCRPPRATAPGGEHTATVRTEPRRVDGDHDDDDDDDDDYDDDYDHRNDLRRRREAGSTSPKRSRLRKSQSSRMLKQPHPLYDSSSSSHASNKRIVNNYNTMEKPAVCSRVEERKCWVLP